MFTHTLNTGANSRTLKTQLSPPTGFYLCFFCCSIRKRDRQSESERDIYTMMMAAPAKSIGMAGKKTRKPYTITRPRERWVAEEHDRFLHALVLFGRDWKRIEAFVATKTSTQIRSHAQKHFLRAQKLGLSVAPLPHPRRAAAAGVRQADETIQLPLSPDDPHFALVCRGPVRCARGTGPLGSA
ncbi:hypothetical protein SEVIR_9G112600v4 [Setaria viridis]|uniref:HTH myb-type domain-containing protein n=1 Tax=Setaria viridis TaxID=4556 RepID=A0A4V6D0R1_SETVI|nr:protein REVEILLE 8-like isoform X1 [Setaria viridis]TKV91675.1 hypothetical protein SEVIR_9G112600v2 [Setaria viridis]